MTKQETPKRPMVIRYKEEWVVDGVGKLSRLTAIDPKKAAELKEKEVIWQGLVILGIPTPQGVAQMPVEFEVDATDVEHAFSQFHEKALEAFRANMDEMKRQQQEQQSKIVTASSMPNLKIVE